MVHLLCPRCIKFCNDPKLLDKFRESAKLLDMVQKGLSDYLETKRAGFSRFYFLSNDELLEILSQTKVGKRARTHARTHARTDVPQFFCACVHRSMALPPYTRSLNLIHPLGGRCDREAMVDVGLH